MLLLTLQNQKRKKRDWGKTVVVQRKEFCEFQNCGLPGFRR